MDTDTAVKVLEFKKQVQDIVKDKEVEEISKDDVDRLVNLIEDYVDDAYEAEGLSTGGASADVKMIGLDQIGAAISEVPKFKNKLIWAALHEFFGAAVEETRAQWKLSTQVHLKIDELQEYLDRYNMGMGSVMLYHCDGNDDRAVISYVINGITKSRFSHATMLMPQPDYPGLPVLWQSAHACEGKLGGGMTRNGPDLADLKEMIRAYYKGWPSSRFVFRPIKKALDSEEQIKSLQFVQKILHDPNMTFPSIAKLYWTWILSRHPKYASLAHLCNFDAGVDKDNYNTMFCSQTVTATLLAAGVLNPPIKEGQFSPAEYGLPYDTVGQTVNDKLYGAEYEFIFDDLLPQPAH